MFLQIISLIVILLLLVVVIRRFISRRAGAQQAAASTQLYIGNLDYRVRERDLSEFFQKFGKVSKAKVVMDGRSRRSKGFGFVTYHDTKSAQKALAAHGQSFNGRNLVVRYANPR